MEKDKQIKKKRKKKSEDTQSSLPPCGLAEDILGSSLKDNMDSGDENKEPENGNGDASEEKIIKYITFFLDKEEYGLPIHQVQEINRVPKITRVPKSREHIMGVINLRGKIVPVIELKRRLDLGDTSVDKDSRVVVVEHGSNPLGLMVDRVSQVLNLSSSQIEDTPEEGVVEKHKKYVKGIGKIEDRMIMLFDLEKVLNHKIEHEANK